jgi:hypothetical protein
MTKRFKAKKVSEDIAGIAPGFGTGIDAPPTGPEFFNEPGTTPQKTKKPVLGKKSRMKLSETNEAPGEDVGASNLTFMHIPAGGSEAPKSIRHIVQRIVKAKNAKVQEIPRKPITFLKRPAVTEDAKSIWDKPNPLNRPGNVFTDFDQALQMAEKELKGKSGDADRFYVLKYKYYHITNQRKYVVIYNKTLLSQVPDYKNKGYEIVAWVSQKDGVVIKQKNGTYAKAHDPNA